MTEKLQQVIPMDDYGTMTNNGDKVKLIHGRTAKKETEDQQSLLERVKYQRKHLHKDCFFTDGKRKIDFVIVWEEDREERDEKLDSRNEKFRQKFFSNLKKIGVQMEEATVTSEKKIIHCMKLYITHELMYIYAEDLMLRAPLQLKDVHPNPSENWSERVLEVFHIPNLMSQRVPNQPPDFFTCPFKKSKMDKFLGSDDPESYFSPTQRHQVAYEIIATQPYGKRRKAEIGIDRMIEEDIFSGAYPLHEGPYKATKEEMANPELLNARQVLYNYWAKWGLWYKYQPLDHIREYYGEKIGFYFAWLGLYTAWLLPASIIGIIVFCYGLATFQNNIPAKEVCVSNNTFKMCPLCDENIGCNYWYLSDVCLYIKIAYLFDHPGTVFYAIFMALWAVTFLENWKRKNASLGHHWDVMDFEEDEERPRPEFCALCDCQEMNPITGVMEPHFPSKKRIPRMCMGIGVVLIMMVLVFIFIMAVIIYRVLIAIPFFQNQLLRAQAMLFASTTAAVVNLILIMSLGMVYEKLAYKLTQWEMHRTQTEFDNQLIFKVFLFQMFNFYSSIFYIAFFKGKFTGYPGNYVHFFGLRNEECNNGGCLIELAQQLVVIMIGKQFINNCQEVFLPKLKTWLHRFTKGLDSLDPDKVVELWEEDYKLIEYEGLLEEYLEMVLQFGFITIFVAAFPLAPFFALINNWLEIRLDASKLVCETRRPLAERAQDIGVWFDILDVICKLAVISNAFLIAFTSEFLPKILYQYKYRSDLSGYVNYTLAWAPHNTTKEACRYQAFRDEHGNFTIFNWELLAVRLAFVIFFEHVVFFISRMLDIMIPDVPRSLEIKIKREQYLAKQALLDTSLKKPIVTAEDD